MAATWRAASGRIFSVPTTASSSRASTATRSSITLDLKKAGARDVLHALVRSADGVLDNLRGDLPDKLGLTYAALDAANPRIVCAHLSAYGRTGSRAAWPGYDYLMQAEAGYLSLTGEPDGPPARMGLSIVDLMTGPVRGVRAALRHHRRARDRRRARHRRQPVRLRAAESELSGDLVSQRGP